MDPANGGRVLRSSPAEKLDQLVTPERRKQVMGARFGDESGFVHGKSEEGFTLVELLIVVVVLGVLAGAAVFGLSGTTATSQEASCKTDIRAVEAAVDAYHSANDPNWPTTMADLTGTDASGDGPYLRTQPVDDHYTITLDPAGSGHVFLNPVQGSIAPGQDYDAALNATPPVDLCDQVK